MELYGFNVPEENWELKNLLADIFLMAFPDGQEQINLETESLWNRLNKRYQLSKVREIYIHASCLYYAYYKDGGGNINRVDEMYFFSSVRDKYGLPRVDMLIIYDVLKGKSEINPNQCRNIIVQDFEHNIQEVMKKNSKFSLRCDDMRRLTYSLAITTVWLNYLSTNYSQLIEKTGLAKMEIEKIIEEIKEEMRKKYA